MSETAEQPVENGAFQLGEPVLVCRWRLHARKVPLLNRHIRALAARRVAGEPLSRGLLSWAKQHVEWSLADDTTVPVPEDGVLMLVVDKTGQAAMSTGAYEPLPDTSAEALAQRAINAQREAQETDVAPEVLACVADGALTLGVAEEATLCGAASLAEQLARARGCAVTRDPALPFRALAGMGEAAQGALLLSDEHGAVLASDADELAPAAADLAILLTEGYEKLFRC